MSWHVQFHLTYAPQEYKDISCTKPEGKVLQAANEIRKKQNKKKVMKEGRKPKYSINEFKKYIFVV